MKNKIFLSFLSLIFATMIISTSYSLAMIMELSDIGVLVMLTGGIVMATLCAMMIFEPQTNVVHIVPICEKTSNLPLQ